MFVGRWATVVAAVLLVLAGAAVGYGFWQTPRPPSFMVDLPAVERDLAPAEQRVGGTPPPEVETAAEAASAAEALSSGPPLLADPDLLESTPFGRVPRVAADGRSALAHYRRVEPRDEAPRIGLFLTEIGLARTIAERAASLPPGIAFATSAYAADGPSWQAWVRAGGREALLTLPIFPSQPYEDDQGPDALAPAEAEGPAILALDRLLARGRGYVAVAMPAGSFALDPARFLPLAQSLARRGLGMVELGGARLAAVAAEARLPYLPAKGPLDELRSAEAIDAALAELETTALAQGRAIGYARAMPITIERLTAWALALPRKGIRLVGPGDLLLP